MPLPKPLIPLLIFISIISVLSIAISPAHAADTGLITCGRQFVSDQGLSAICTICDLFALFQNIINSILLYFTAPLAALMLGYGGFLMVIGGLKGNPSEATKGKKVLLNVVIGIIIILASWLLVDTIIKSVGGFPESEGFGPWNEIQCIAPAIKFPTHFGCDKDKKCVQMDGSQGNECEGVGKDFNCTQHYECNKNTQQCVLINEKGKNECAGTDDTTTCKVSHTVCVAKNSCALFPGVGPNECGTTPDNSKCTDTVDLGAISEMAKALADQGIKFSSSSDCGGVSASTNFKDMQDKKLLTVCHHGCSTDKTACTPDGPNINVKLMQDLVDVSNPNGTNLKFRVTSFATGDHAANSGHYTGKAVDIQMLFGFTNLYPQYEQAINNLNTSGQLKLLQCENKGNVVTCDGKDPLGKPDHLHIEYK